MKRLLTIITTMMLAMTMEAQSPLILGESHAMLRVKNETKYLLLPVQEKEENAHIAVVDSRNEMVQRLNVRLAVDKVDYYVPLDLSKLSYGCRISYQESGRRACTNRRIYCR